jgi:hypothetical protein
MNVTCAVCGAGAELPDGELLDPRVGYRCVTCTYTAEQALASRRAKIGLAMIGSGAVMLVICALMWMAKWDVDFGSVHDDDATSLFLYIGFAAIVLIALGLSHQRRFRRRLREPGP